MLDSLDRHLNLNAGRTANNALVSVLFSLAHVYGSGLSHALMVFIPSMALGWVWQRWRSLPVCVVVHGLFNVFYIYVVQTAFLPAGSGFLGRL